MSRQPKARTKVLEAARKIVQESGAGALTFDELSRVSGVTRGGITYHFPTKDALLRGLLEHDMEHAVPLDPAGLAARPLWFRLATRAARLMAPVQ